jgi:tRNA splicing endonuclease
MKKNNYQSLFVNYNKNSWLIELTQIDSNIYVIIKEEVEELFFNAGGYLKYLNFESCYKLATEMTSTQIKKNIKKNKKCFFENENNDNFLAYQKIKQRLVNNIKNLFDSNRKFNLVNFEIWQIDEIYENHEIDFTIRDLQKLSITEPQIIIDNLKILASNFELTIIEIDEICEKINLKFTDIIKIDLSLQFKNLRKASNNQTYFDFEEEMVVA